MPPPSHDHPEYRAWERAARRVNEMVPYFQRIEIPPPVIRTVYMTRSTPSYVPPRREVVVVSAPLVPSVVFVPPPPPLPPVIVVNPPPRRRPKPVVVVQPSNSNSKTQVSSSSPCKTTLKSPSHGQYRS
ncbi:MAG: hypothetical protein HWD61_04300 [Parachlamydiaceae bacterium]|nr:MAG: hypothetical protein HWD61_04300 [Parachlamydiaceae bacterium]